MRAFQIVQATTASAMTADEWKNAWMLAAPVVVAAGRYLDAEAEGNAALIEDAHFQLLRAMTDYKAAAETTGQSSRCTEEEAIDAAERSITADGGDGT